METSLKEKNLHLVKIELTNSQVSKIISDFIEKKWGFKVVETPYMKQDYERSRRHDFMMCDDSCYSVVSTIQIADVIDEGASLSKATIEGVLSTVVTLKENI